MAKEEEQKLSGWTAKRELSKINCRIHTDAIKSHLRPKEVTSAQASIIYAEEADVLNVAMFGMTAKQWRGANPELKGNIRDYATIAASVVRGADCLRRTFRLVSSKHTGFTPDAGPRRSYLEFVTAITKVFSIADEDVLDALVDESDEIAHICELYQCKMAS